LRTPRDYCSNQTPRKSIGLESVLAGEPAHLYEKDGFMYVAQKLSSLSAAAGKETSHGDGRMFLRQVHLEGLVC
jgi:hypothetical protein